MNLLQLKEKTENKKSIEKLLKKAETELNAENEKLNRLTVLLKKEHKDVQQLENGGLTAMFHSFLGNKVEKLEKERQEYFAAKLKYDNCKNAIEDLNLEIEKCKKQIIGFGNPQVEYKKILDERSLLLKENQDSEFLKYEELLEIYYSQKKEINEAIAAGEKAIQGLKYAIGYLQKAANWGTFDMLGGGLLATAAKHSNIDEAKGLIHDVQIWLRKFKRELSDIRNSEFPEMNVQIDSFATFADYFFDNLIFDWAVQNKINRSLEGCRKVFAQVSTLLLKLKQSDVQVTEKYKSTKEQFNQYIEKSLFKS